MIPCRYVGLIVSGRLAHGGSNVVTWKKFSKRRHPRSATTQLARSLDAQARSVSTKKLNRSLHETRRRLDDDGALALTATQTRGSLQRIPVCECESNCDPAVYIGAVWHAAMRDNTTTTTCLPIVTGGDREVNTILPHHLNHRLGMWTSEHTRVSSQHIFVYIRWCIRWSL